MLKYLIALDPAAWRAADCEQLIAVLGHPLYVLAYFETLADDPAEVLPDTVLNAIEETARLVGREWNPYDPDTPPRHDIWRAMLPALTRLDLPTAPSANACGAAGDGIRHP